MSLPSTGNPELDTLVANLSASLGPGYTLEQLLTMCAEAVTVKNFTSITIVGDGSCFWRSILAHFEKYQLIDYLRWLADEYRERVFRSFPEHQELYQEVLDALTCGYFPLDKQLVMFLKVITAIHILEKRQDYRYIPLDGLTLEEWVAQFVLEYDTWADHEAIKAVADVMNINIHIHKHTRETLIIKGVGRCAFADVHVFYSGTHYSLLLHQQ
jgi:hypothetical protein